MRVLMVRPGPSFSVQDVAFGWRDALRELGVTVADFNFDDRLDFYVAAELEKDGEYHRAFSYDEAIQLAAKGILAACYEFLPDVVLIVSGFFVPPDVLRLMRARGHKIVVLCTESPYEDDKQFRFAQYADTILLNDPCNIERFRVAHNDTHYMPHAYDPKRHYPGPGLAEMKCDFAFVGTGFPSRIKFFEEIDFDGLDVILGGNWQSLDEHSSLAPFVAHPLDECIDNREAAYLYRSTRSSLNLYRREHTDDADADGVAMGPREVELAACGTFFLRDPRPESDELFPMLPTFTEADEVRPLLDWWLTHDVAREQAALEAHTAVADRTFVANARWLLQHVSRKGLS